MDVVDKLTQDDTIVRIRIWDGTPRPTRDGSDSDSLTLRVRAFALSHARETSPYMRTAPRGAVQRKGPDSGPLCFRRERMQAPSRVFRSAETA